MTRSSLYPCLADIYETALHLAYREFPRVHTPLHVPACLVANWLMYRAGLDAEFIAELSHRTRREVACGLAFVNGMRSYPHLEQALTGLLGKMPVLPIEDECEVIAFPGPSKLSRQKVVPLQS